MNTLYRFLDWLLQWTVILLMVTLTVIVILAVFARKFGSSFVWYDEVASVLLAWITYYGAALAALKRRHIGFDGVLLRLPLKVRMAAVVVAEVLVIGFFALLAWTGLEVLAVVGGDTLVSLPWVPISLTQSVIPISAALFIICELISLPDYWRAMIAGQSLEHPEIEPERT
ncbi:MAG: C4-dicarboxylate ABC transporter permease [Proteobacteria bacterium]|jgi:TRAP-type C4-dicarboxylate transport system, small permease component|nr:MAG: C4-dicarboxylate ABC transporter permease [Pseudomonadota bacterium]